LRYIWNLGKIIYPNKQNPENATEECKKWIDECVKILIKSSGVEFKKFLELESYDNKILKRDFDNLTSYFNNNYKRMDYHLAISNNLPIGSGELVI